MNRKARRLEAKQSKNTQKKSPRTKDILRAGMSAVVAAGMLGTTLSTPVFAVGIDCRVDLTPTFTMGSKEGSQRGTDYQYREIHTLIQAQLNNVNCATIVFDDGEEFLDQNDVVANDGSVPEGYLPFKLDNTDTIPGVGVGFLSNLGAFTVNRNVTIDGSLEGTTNLTIDAENLNRIFTITGSANVTFRDIRFINGLHNNGGGAISSNGALTFDNVDFIDNDSYDNGGAVNTSSTVSVINGSYFANNWAEDFYDQQGGAIWATGDVSVADSVFFDNYADGKAGAIYSGGNVTFDNSDFTSNHSGANGGAIYAQGNIDGIDGIDGYDSSRLGLNSADNDGGALYAQGNIEISNSDIYDNSATGDGGALYAEGNIEVFSSDIYDNSALGDGGALYSENDVTAYYTDFYENSSASDGGAIYSEDSTLVSQNIFRRNDAALDGGAIYSEEETAVVDNVFTGNGADDDGGAIYSSGPIEVVASDFYDNTGNDDGGAIYSESIFSSQDLSRIGDLNVDAPVNSVRGMIPKVVKITWDENLVIRQSSFQKNGQGNSEAIYADEGGAIFLNGSGKIVGSDFYDNFADSYGGAIYATQESSLEVVKSQFESNSTDDDDGGAITSHGYLEISEGWFQNNYADEDGGAIWTDGILNLSYSIFENNYALEDGGAIWAEGDVTDVGGAYTDNYANSDGGAMDVQGDLDLYGTSFGDNTAGYGDGGAIKISENEGTDILIEDALFYDNDADYGDGGAIVITGSDHEAKNVTILNSTFVMNAAGQASLNSIQPDNHTFDTYDGGAISVRRDSANVRIEGSHFISNFSEIGGAIGVHADRFSLDNNSYNETDGGAQVSVDSSTFSGNTGMQGAAIASAAQNRDSLVVTNSTFVYNAGKHSDILRFIAGFVPFGPGGITIPEAILGQGTIAVSNGLIAGNTFVNNYTHADVWATDAYDDVQMVVAGASSDTDLGLSDFYEFPGLGDTPSQFDQEDYNSYMSSGASVAVFGNIFAVQEDAFPFTGVSWAGLPWDVNAEHLIQDPRVSWGSPDSDWLNAGGRNINSNFVNNNGFTFDSGPIINLGGNLSTSAYFDYDNYDSTPIDPISTEFFLGIATKSDDTYTSFEALEFTNLEAVLRDARAALLSTNIEETVNSLRPIQVLRISEDSSAAGYANRGAIPTEFSRFASLISGKDGEGRTRLDPFDSGAFQINVTTEEPPVVTPPNQNNGGGGGGGFVMSSAPSIASLSQARISVAGGRLTIFGANLTGATSVTVGGKPASMVSVSDTQMVIEVPVGTVGFVDVVVSTARGNAVATRGLEYFAAAAAVQFTDRVVAGGFAPNSARLTPSIKSALRGLLAENPDATIIRCAGFTSTPVLAGDQALAKLRAQRACNYLLKLKPTLEVVSVRGITTTDSGSSVRRVRINIG